ncbi:MAG: FecR domain-containing protein [Kofleriaceae bacterium]
MSDPLFDGGDGDAELTALERSLGTLAHTAPLREPPARPSRAPKRTWIWPVAALAAVVALVVLLLQGKDAADPGCAGGTGFQFSLTAGTATCGGAAVASAGTMPIGAWLETQRDGTATVKVADIGELTVFGDSKLRLVTTGAAQHHLELARGHVAARVTAPPRLFVVDTPAATAVDLGCAYDLTVDAAGKTHLRVTLGAVSLEDSRGISYVPATFEIDVVPGHLGTPISITATPEMRSAVQRFDAGEPGALAELVRTAAVADRVTLWNVIGHTRDPGAIAKLEELAPLPDPALHAKVLAGDADALDIWLDVFVDRGDLAHDQRR